MPAENGSSQVERVLALRGFPGLSGVDPAHLAPLADITTERMFPEGAPLSTRGSEVRAVHLIRGGGVTIHHENGGIRRLGPGDVLGAIAALSRAPDGQYAVAHLETRTFEIDSSDFEDILEDSFELLHTVLRGMMRGVINIRVQLPADAGFSTPIDADAIRPRTEFGLVERVLFLRRLMTYGRARVEALAELARDMSEVRVAAGTELFRIGDPSPYALLVWSGIVVGETAKGHRFRFGPESVVGGIDSIAAQPRWYRAVAETDVVALQSNAATLMDVIEDNPDLGLDMLRSSARVLGELQARLDGMAADAAK